MLLKVQLSGISCSRLLIVTTVVNLCALVCADERRKTNPPMYPRCIKRTRTGYEYQMPQPLHELLVSTATRVRVHRSSTLPIELPSVDHTTPHWPPLPPKPLLSVGERSPLAVLRCRLSFPARYTSGTSAILYSCSVALSTGADRP